MDILRLQIEDALNLALEHACRGDPSSLLRDHGHREAFVQQPQFAFRRLLVCRIQEDAAIQERAVDVGDHGSDVPGRVALLFALRDVLLDLCVPMRGITLVDEYIFLPPPSGMVTLPM